jgi:hypothetical protein
MATKPSTGSKVNSAKDLLSSLTKGKKPTGKAATPNRPEVELNPVLEHSFIRFAGASALAEEVKSRIDQEKEILNEGFFDQWTTNLWKTNRRPPNPAIEIKKNSQVDISGIFQVQDRASINVDQPQGEETLVDAAVRTITDVFVSIGTSEKDAKATAENLVSSEMNLTPKPVVDLDRLVNGEEKGEGKNRTFVEATEEQQALGAKLIQLIKDNFTDEEREELLSYIPQVNVKKGFLERICSYLQNEDQLKALLKIIKYTHFPQAKKFGAADTAQERNERLHGVAKDILGVG